MAATAAMAAGVAAAFLVAVVPAADATISSGFSFCSAAAEALSKAPGLAHLENRLL